MRFLARRLCAVTAVALAVPVVAGAQAVCHGTPRGTTVALEYGKLNEGNTTGLAATFGGLRLGARLRDIDDDLSGQEFDLRFSVPIGISRFQLCPLLGVGYQRDEWDFDANSTLTSQMVTLKAGAAIGAEFPVAAGFSAIPFLQLAYQFSAIKFDIEAPDSEPEVTGDTLSFVDVEYGLIGRYRNFFAGVAANWDTDSDGFRPYQARWILGFSFSGGSSASRAPVPRSRNSVKKP